MLHCSPTNSIYFLPPEFPPASKHKKLKQEMIDSNGLVFGGGKTRHSATKFQLPLGPQTLWQSALRSFLSASATNKKDLYIVDVML